MQLQEGLHSGPDRECPVQKDAQQQQVPGEHLRLVFHNIQLRVLVTDSSMLGPMGQSEGRVSAVVSPHLQAGVDVLLVLLQALAMQGCACWITCRMQMGPLLLTSEVLHEAASARSTAGETPQNWCTF